MTFKKSSCFILLSFIISMPLSASARLKPSIAVLDLSLSNVSLDTGRIVRNKIEFSFYNSGRFRILERNRLDLLKKESSLSGKNIDSKEYAMEAGRMLPAQYIVIGSVSFNGQYNVHINLVDVKNGSIVYSFDDDYESENMIYAETENIRKGVEDKIFSSFDKEQTADDNNHYYLSVHSGYIPPLRKARFSNGGFLFDAEFGLRNLFSTYLNAGFNTGYSHFYTDGTTNYVSITPLMITASCNIRFSRFGIIPGLGAGSAFITIDKASGTEKAFEPCALIFIKGDIFIRQDIAVEFVSSYYSIYEPKSNIDFFSFSLGIVSYL